MNLSGPDWRIENIKAIIFDKDGTIIDSHKYWGEIIARRSRALMERLRLQEDFHKRICAAMGYDTKEEKLSPLGPIALVSREKVIEILIDFFKQNQINVEFETVAEIFSEVHKSFLKDVCEFSGILPGVYEFFKKIENKKIKIALLTSDSVLNATKIMTHLGLNDFFEIIAGRELSKEEKATGVPAKLICAQLKTLPSETICVGDAIMDVEMSDRADLKAAVAVASGQTPMEELKLKTEYTVKNLNDININ